MKYRNSPNFLVRNFCGNAISIEFRAYHPKLCRNCAFPKKFNTWKLSEISVFCPVTLSDIWSLNNVRLLTPKLRHCEIVTFFTRMSSGYNLTVSSVFGLKHFSCRWSLNHAKIYISQVINLLDSMVDYLRFLRVFWNYSYYH